MPYGIIRKTAFFASLFTQSSCPYKRVNPNFFHSSSLVPFRAQLNSPNAASAVSRALQLAPITVSGQEGDQALVKHSRPPHA